MKMVWYIVMYEMVDFENFWNGYYEGNGVGVLCGLMKWKYLIFVRNFNLEEFLDFVIW